MIRRCITCKAPCHKDAARCGKCSLAHRHREKPGYEPTPEEIAAACEAIRANLSDAERAKRLGLAPQEVETREYGVAMRGAALVFSEK